MVLLVITSDQSEAKWILIGQVKDQELTISISEVKQESRIVF